MREQISKETFAQALLELGHQPSDYQGKRISFAGMCELYQLEQDSVLEAIEHKLVDAHYDYRNDTIWIDALDAAHFYYCLRSTDPRLLRQSLAEFDKKMDR